MLERILLEMIASAAEEAWGDEKLTIHEVHAIFRIWDHLMETQEFEYPKLYVPRRF